MEVAVNSPQQQRLALPSWLQRIGRRDQAGTAQLTVLQETYNRHRAQKELEMAAIASARRASCEAASSQVLLLRKSGIRHINTAQSGCHNSRQSTPPPSEDSLSCPACEQILSRCHDLKKHWRDHCRVQVHEYQCKNCKFQTHSKTYPKKMHTSRKEDAGHELELVRILPAKTYGCPCCGAYLADLKEMKQHVHKNKNHEMKQISRPNDVGQVQRLRGLLQQPDIMKELQYQVSASGSELEEFISTLSWDGPIAKQFADRLQYGVRLEPNGGHNVGVAPHALTMCVTTIVTQAHGGQQGIELPASQITQTLVSAAPIELGGQLVLEKDASPEEHYGTISNRHKRGMSTTSSDISEGFIRSQQGPYFPIERLEFSAQDSPVSPMSTSTRPFHLLPPIQTTNLSTITKGKQIDSGYATDSARPDTLWSSLDSSSTANTLFTSASFHQAKPWDCEQHEPVELSATQQIKSWSLEQHAIAELSATQQVKSWTCEQNGLVELSAAHQFHELPADEFHELPAELFYTDDHESAFHGVKF